MRSQSDLRLGRRLTAAALSGLLAMSSVVPYAFAQPQPPAGAGQPAAKPTTEQEKKDAARSHFGEGKKRLEAKDYAGALAEFQIANDLVPAAQPLYKIGACYDGMGKSAEAIAAYQRFIDAAKNNPKLAADVLAAKARIAELKKAVAALVAVNVTSEPASAAVDVDGQAQPGATPLELKLAPGKHRVKVTAPGYEPMERDIDVVAKQAAPALAFTLVAIAAPLVVPPPSAAPVETAPPVATAPPPAPTTAPPAADLGPQQPRSNLPAYITLGAAGAGVLVGTIFGIKALSSKSDFNGNPTADGADTAERNALIADMAFGVAVTLGVTGAVLLLSNKPEPAPNAAALAPLRSNVRVSPFVGRNAAGAAAVWNF